MFMFVNVTKENRFYNLIVLLETVPADGNRSVAHFI